MKLPGYITMEKRQIARRFLLPKQRKKHGLSQTHLKLSMGALTKIIQGYAREAGVRNLEKEIAKICRKAVTRIAGGKSGNVAVTEKNLETFLGRVRFEDDPLMKKLTPGVATGLAWTSHGGTILYVEAIGIPSGKSGFKQTGQLGHVMVESSTIAFDLIKAEAAARYGGAPDFFDGHFIHLHVPAGATPKDGPSAGLTMAVSLLSLCLGKPVRKSLAMTGELTLTGRILPVGGIKEKVIAAKRAGIREIILPEGNKRDQAELPDYLKKGLTFHPVGTFHDAVKHVFKQYK
jgi:ATP-dependent Lon protease